MTKDLVGIYRNEKIMVWHFVFFIGATFNFICYAMLLAFALSVEDVKE